LLVSGKSLELVFFAVAAMLVLLIALFAAQWFVLHRSARPPAAESRAPDSVAGRTPVGPGMTPERSLQLLADDDQPNAECIARGSCSRS
jgi:hypothetical protein